MTSPRFNGLQTRRGRLHVYLGTAPAVGKSYAMLQEGRLLEATGADVVVGYLEAHGRDDTTALVEGLPVVPAKATSYRGATFLEMDTDAILLRHPQVALVDELAHSNVPGQRHAKRWQDIDDLLDAGIDVISNVNIQHLDSVHDDVERLTDVAQRETVPDDFVAAADRVDLVDVAPEALRDRVQHRAALAFVDGDIALSRWFTTDNLGALHNLAVGWMERHARSTETAQPGGTPSRASVVVSLDAGPQNDRLLRRSAQIARRSDAPLIGVHVRTPTGLVESDRGLEHRRRLLAELGGSYAEVGALDRGDAFMRFAREQRASEVVVGTRPRSRVQRLLHGAELDRLVQTSGTIELHVLPIDDRAPTAPGRARRASRPRVAPRRRLLAWLLALVGPSAVAASLSPWRASLGLAGALLALLLLITIVASIGGLAPSLVAAVLALALADFLFTVPYHSFRVDRLVDIVGLLAFAGVAIIVSILVDQVARASLQAVHGRAEAEGVARLAAAALPGALAAKPELLDELRTVFRLDSVALMARSNIGWDVVRAFGDQIPERPDDGSAVLPIGSDWVIVLTGGGLPEAGSSLLRELVAEAGRSEARAQLSRLRNGASRRRSSAAD